MLKYADFFSSFDIFPINGIILVNQLMASDNKMKFELRRSLLAILVITLGLPAFAQTDIINDIKSAMKTGNSKEIVKYFHDVVELGIISDKVDYSKTQAEFIMKDFFKKYPPTDFQYAHKGASPDGARYAMGKYLHDKGSFGFYLVMRPVNGKYLIESLNFYEE
jgi:hypothetical protein